MTIQPPPTDPEEGQATVHWTMMDTNALVPGNAGFPGPAITNQGNVGAEDLSPGTHTYVPAFSVDDNCAIVGFSASSSSRSVGGYYASIDIYGMNGPPGITVPTSTHKAGEDTYVRLSGGSENRWGNYAALVLDPTASNTFWIANAYAQMSDPGGAPQEDGCWGIHVGTAACPTELPVELKHFSAVADGTAALLIWRTASETNNAGFEIQIRKSKIQIGT